MAHREMPRILSGGGSWLRSTRGSAKSPKGSSHGRRSSGMMASLPGPGHAGSRLSLSQPISPTLMRLPCDALLFKTGADGSIDEACRRATVGKLLPDDLYVHRNALDSLEPLLRIYEGCGR